MVVDADAFLVVPMISCVREALLERTTNATAAKPINWKKGKIVLLSFSLGVIIGRCCCRRRHHWDGHDYFIVVFSNWNCRNWTCTGTALAHLLIADTVVERCRRDDDC